MMIRLSILVLALVGCAWGQDDDLDICDLPAVEGLCRGYFPRYYYDSSDGTCKSFIYGGCGGNLNNFEDVEECEAACKNDKKKSATAHSSNTGGRPDYCYLPLATGICDALIPSFYYDAGAGTCQSFVFGGCRGNKNRFQTYEECVTVCQAEHP